MANSEDPEQSDLGLYCSSRPFRQATSVRNFRTLTIHFVSYVKLFSVHAG